MPQRTAVVAAVAAALSWAALSAGPADAYGGDHGHGGDQGPPRVAVPDATVAGPVSTPLAPNRIQGFPYTASAINLRSHGYTEKEYFVSGTARAYSPVGTLGTDGRWAVTQASTAPYKTRILVRRPQNMRRFNGNVVVEWMNATTGRDLDVGWTFGYRGMLREGDIYVGVTAQGLPITSATGLKAWDPQRYGSLSIPDDAYSYDIFSQVGKALLSPQNSAVPRRRPAQAAHRLRRLAVGVPARDLCGRHPAARPDL